MKMKSILLLLFLFIIPIGFSYLFENCPSGVYFNYDNGTTCCYGTDSCGVERESLPTAELYENDNSLVIALLIGIFALLLFRKSTGRYHKF